MLVCDLADLSEVLSRKNASARIGRVVDENGFRVFVDLRAQMLDVDLPLRLGVEVVKFGHEPVAPAYCTI